MVAQRLGEWKKHLNHILEARLKVLEKKAVGNTPDDLKRKSLDQILSGMDVKVPAGAKKNYVVSLLIRDYKKDIMRRVDLTEWGNLSEWHKSPFVQALKYRFRGYFAVPRLYTCFPCPLPTSTPISSPPSLSPAAQSPKL